MRLAHISDLHLGKRVHNYPMIEEQKYILKQMLDIFEREKVDGIMIAGDIYDKAIPSEEAVALFDDFMTQMVERKWQVYVISGNHDSAERLAFGERILRHSGVHISPVYCGAAKPIVTEDAYGEIHMYLLPFVKPVHIRHYHETEVYDYTDALQCAIESMQVDTEKRNILIAHQFVTGAVRCDSEEVAVGGLDNVSKDVFEEFDYVALGHLHGPQNVGEHIRYSGSPLKYSFSEEKQKKSVTIVDIKEKGCVEHYTVPLVSLHDFVTIEGHYEVITSDEYLANADTEAYVRVILQDEQEIRNAYNKLIALYPNMMQMEYANRSVGGRMELSDDIADRRLTPEEIFARFYQEVNHKPMERMQEEYLREMIEKVWRAEE